MRKGFFIAFVTVLSIIGTVPSYANIDSINAETEEAYGAYTSKKGEPMAYRDSKDRFEFYSDGVGTKLTLKDNHKAYLSNWVFFKGKYYYFGDNGYLLVNAVAPGGFVVDATGAWTGEKSSATAAYPKDSYFGTYQDYKAKAQAGIKENEMGLGIYPGGEFYAFSNEGASYYRDYDIYGNCWSGIYFIDYDTLPNDHIALKVYDAFQPYNKCGFHYFDVINTSHEIIIRNPEDQNLWMATYPTLFKIREQFESENPEWKVFFSNYGVWN